MQQWIEKWDGKLSNVSSGEMPYVEYKNRKG